MVCITKIKGAVRWGKILTILTILGILLGGYFSIPNIIWLIQPQTINQVCPSLLINQSSNGVQLKNIGRIPASLTVNFEGNNISFVDDRGNINSNFTVSYAIEAGQPLSYNFKPIFSLSEYTESIKISAECFYFLGFVCLNGNMSKCCYYSRTLSSNSISIINETDC